MQPNSHWLSSSFNLNALVFVLAGADETAEHIDFTLMSTQKDTTLKRYCFTRVPGSKVCGLREMERLFRDDTITLLHLDLFDQGRRAVAKFCEISCDSQEEFDIDDQEKLLRLINAYGVRMTSHFNMCERV